MSVQDKNIITMKDVLDYVERKTISKKRLAQHKVVMREQTRKSSMNGLMRGAYNQCGDSAIMTIADRHRTRPRQASRTSRVLSL